MAPEWQFWHAFATEQFGEGARHREVETGQELRPRRGNRHRLQSQAARTRSNRAEAGLSRPERRFGRKRGPYKALRHAGLHDHRLSRILDTEWCDLQVRSVASTFHAKPPIP